MIAGRSFSRQRKDFGFHKLEMLLAGRKYSSPDGAAAERSWNIRIPISDRDYVELTRPFDVPVQTAVVAPLADILRKTLEPKLPRFGWSGSISMRPEMELTLHVASSGMTQH